MRVQIEYAAQLKRAAGVRTESIELADGASLRDLCATVASQHDAELRAMLLDENELPRSTLLIFLNDAQVPAGTNPTLSDGAEVSLMSPISGG